MQKALDDGCEKTVVILTQHKGYTKSPINKNVAKLLSKKYPQMAKAMLVRQEMYNNQLALIDKLEAEGKIFVIRPSESLNCPTLEKEKATLEAELPNIQGLFSGSKKAKIEARIAEIEKELQTLK